MIVNNSVALFVVAMLLQQYYCKPTRRFVREISNEDDEPRINKIKEFLGQLQGYGSFGSTSQPQSSSTPIHQPDSSTSYLQETAAGPEPAETKIQPSIMARDGST
ncbi:unnamed protein product [Aphis gossypii]|uniref:Uncharacterized protein n=1 Tax=Aphis gossypii TaxID=80765 RepID=A0A9P0IX12_APHGO|nr:unnamed protein product [Aphis gossypii]